MDTSSNLALGGTPRRSLRVQKLREQSPEVLDSRKASGPRQMAKMKKKLNQTAPAVIADPVEDPVESTTEEKSKSSKAEAKIENSSINKIQHEKQPQTINQVELIEPKHRGRKGKKLKTSKKPSEEQDVGEEFDKIFNNITKETEVADTAEEEAGALKNDSIPKVIITRPTLNANEVIPALKQENIDTATIEESKNIGDNLNNSNKKASFSEITKQPSAGQNELSALSSVTSDLSSEKDQSTVIEVENSTGSLLVSLDVDIECPLALVEPEAKIDIKPTEETNFPAKSEEKPEEVVSVKIEKQVNETEEKVSSAETIWEPQEANSVTESSSGMSNGKFHSTVPSVQDTYLMDESIILVPDSPDVIAQRPKDSTFSPVVDKSINDTRPNIDLVAPLKFVSLRTSTPLAQRVMQFGKEASSLMKKNLITKPDESFAQEVFKPVSMLEKSILKSSRRKRSMSVADGESFMQKRVMFNSPQVMEINAIDEKMMASFIEEKENSVMIQAAHSGRRKRSLSTGTPIKTKIQVQSKVKVPNFRAIHEQQFEKMESIADHALRKADRAKKLATPTRVPEVVRPKLQQLSKIPTITSRKPLITSSSIENLDGKNKKGSRLLKRSISASGEEPPRKKIQGSSPYITFPIKPIAEASPGPSRKVAVVNALQRSNSESSNSVWNAPSTSNAFTIGTKKTPTKSSATRTAAESRAKIEERREKNFSLYKTNQTQRTVTTDHRSKNANLLKGVRLNRRFELQMKHRRNTEDN